jgi:hypothetical protein
MSSLLTVLKRRAGTLGSLSSAAMNTSNTNNLGADGLTWAQGYQPTIDQYGKIVTMVQINSSGLAWLVSNNSGASWSDIGTSGDSAYPIPVTRMAMAYDRINDKFHVLYAGTSTDGMIYRRYTPTRDGSNNISAFTKDVNTNLQLDFNASGDYQHPLLFFMSDIGANGALVAIWHAHKSAGGTEVRASMRVLTNAAADGVAGNWTHLGVNSVDAISMAPAVAYTALFSTTNTNAGNGWPCVVRKPETAPTNAKDLSIFYVENVGGTTLTWRNRRMRWASGSSNWATGLTAAVSVGALLRAGTNSGYTLKYQIGSKPVYIPGADKIAFAYCDWKDNTNGDTWLFKYVDSADVVSSAVDVYSGLAANMHATIFITGDIAYDSESGRLIVTYTNLPAKDALVTLYDGTTQVMAPATFFSSKPCDIPIVLNDRVGGKTIFLFRDFNTAARNNPPTYTPPYLGYWATGSWS